MSNPPNHPPSAGAPPVRQNAAGGPASSMNKEPSAEVLVDLLHAQRQISSLSQDLNELKTRLARRTHQMSVLQHVAEILAATPKVAQVASVVLDVFVQEFGAKSAMVWVLEDSGGLLPAPGRLRPAADGLEPDPAAGPQPVPRLADGAVPGPVAGPGPA